MSFYLLGRFLKVHHQSLQCRKSNYSDVTNNGEVPLPKLEASCEFVAFEKIHGTEPILNVVSNIAEDVQFRCFY